MKTGRQLIVSHAVGVILIIMLLLVLAAASRASAQTAQESVERTIGSLVVNNATCSAQVLSLQDQLRKAQAEIEKLKAPVGDNKERK